MELWSLLLGINRIQFYPLLLWEDTALVICALQFLRIIVVANGCYVGNVKCTII